MDSEESEGKRVDLCLMVDLTQKLTSVTKDVLERETVLSLNR